MANTSEYNKAYYKANKQKILERNRKSQALWAKKNPEYIKQWNLKNKDRLKKYRRDYNLRKKYGISLDEYDTTLKNQNGVCAICGVNASGHNSSKFVVDHNHNTNKTRGILCHKCNVMLGYACEDTTILSKAIQYIEKYKEK